MRSPLEEAFDENQRLWRYFRTDRFIELLETGELYFASARQFQDRFEGATAVLPYGTPEDPRFPLRENFGERAFEELRRLTKVSCWHRAAYESDAMWQLYAGAWKGVAICTTPARIASAASVFKLEPHHAGEELWAGNVQYIDLLQQRLNVSMMSRFWYKHMAFAWEQEFRLGISLRHAEEFGVRVPELGIKVLFGLKTLVESIYLGPSLDASEVTNVRNAVEEVGLAARLKVSSMLGIPRYT